ncbi:hypothetical protein LPB138_07785 [Urechidicola croceus]|uniref:AMP-activated protein kinase glycogen-binding domain-containing protein n=2 Tax=Urechidicola croceus TaxID=1850246 RepID=A0A1D8P7N4_9FLAO|nr:hypothetical protein LPB138_07785 [Urechidicola croceus]
MTYAQIIPADGYRIEGDKVIFSFDKRDYFKASVDDEGYTLDFADLDIEKVVVAGEFNNWSNKKWRMNKIDENRYELIKDLDDFDDQFTWEFKFVVNNLYWAEPSKEMMNTTPAIKNGRNLHVLNLKMYTAVPDKNGNATFKLKGHENADKVVLSGTFNRWDEQLFLMNKTIDGWELTLKLRPDIYEYKFIVDGNWIEDPDNPKKKRNEFHGWNSVLDIKVPVTFVLDGHTDAHKVILAGSFNDWNEHKLKMTKTATGWEATIVLSGGKHHYKFIVDGNWMEDPDNSVKEYDYSGNINSVKMVK